MLVSVVTLYPIELYVLMSAMTLYCFVCREADQVKDQGNISFKAGNYMEAIMKYTDAIAICPLSARKKQAIYYR